MKDDYVNKLEGRCLANTISIALITAMVLFVLRTAPRLFTMVK